MRALAAALTFCVLWSTMLGCGGDRACIRWGAHEGPCPGRDEALEFMGPDPDCKERIVSIDSDPEIDEDAKVGGTLCCYDVTKEDVSYCDVYGE
jgi:hypothetical protein